MSNSRAHVAQRIAHEIEQLVTEFYPGNGMLGPRMFVELPDAMQWKVLHDRVNWTGLTPAEKDQVMARALNDVREKPPEEIYPATWFDGILVSVDHRTTVFDLGAVREQLATPGRHTNLADRVCSPLPTSELAAALFGGDALVPEKRPEIQKESPQHDPAGRSR